MDNITGPDVRGEIINLSTTVEGISQSSLAMQAASFGVSQAIASWNLPVLIEGLIAILSATSEAQGTAISTAAEAQGTAISMAAEAQGSTTLSAFETQGTVLTTLNDGLLTNTNDKFSELITVISGTQEISDANSATKSDEIKDTLSGIADIAKNWMDNDHPFLDGLAKSFFGDLSKSLQSTQDCLDDSVKEVNGTIQGVKNEQETLPGILDQKISGPIQAQVEDIEVTKASSEGILQNTKDINESETESVSLAKSANNIALAANYIAVIGNTIAAMGIMNPIALIAATSLAVVSAGIAGFSMTFADGGFPSMGQMFIAREAGPELVGTIGSRSAVVNNDQIVESVSAGVYRAVKAAMGQNGGGVIQLILDGTKVAEVVSDNVNAITRRTGRCPIMV